MNGFEIGVAIFVVFIVCAVAGNVMQAKKKADEIKKEREEFKEYRKEMLKRK